MIKPTVAVAIGALSIAATVSAAAAADLGSYRPASTPEQFYDPPAPKTWRGFYAGVNGGYAWGSTDPVIVSGGSASGAMAAIDPDGWLGGGQIGYNAEFGRFVLGVEADIQGGNIEGSTAGIIGAPPFAAAASSEMNWLSTMRARAGVSTGPVLLYATGGLAFGDFDYTLAGADGSFAAGGKTLTGYAVGGGMEWALSPNWSLKSEYLYIDLGDARIAGVDGGGAPISANFDNAFHTIRAGLNYRF
ncbi:MAG: outer membrane protein [Hyphomicrobiaceae bacterium]